MYINYIKKFIEDTFLFNKCCSNIISQLLIFIDIKDFQNTQ